jgi:tripartite-type tricarboxylate transporter receptor subunit TctC
MVNAQRKSSLLSSHRARPVGFLAATGQAQRAFHLLAGAWIALAMTTAVAADYPTRAIHFIVPSAAGSASDINARLVSTELHKQMGQAIIIENRFGAGGIIGAQLIARAVPDGYTIGYGNAPMLAINRSLYAKLPYDSDAFQMVVQLGNQPLVLAVTPTLPVRSVKELISYAKNNPDKLTHGSGGNGTGQHLTMELFKFMTGTQIIHAQYKSSPQAIADMMAGQIQVLFDNLGPILPHLKSGKVRGLAVSGATRSSVVDLPTVAEAGVPGFEVINFGGVVAPVGVPKDIVARLNAEINKALLSPILKEKFTANGYQLTGGTPEQFESLVRKEIVKWADVIKRSGATAE